MSAKIVSNDRNHERQMLHELIPLDTPFTIGIEPSGYCNLKCNFCIHSLPKDRMVELKHRFGIMEKATFDILVKQLQGFPRKIKNIAFGCQGEPLLNKELPHMVKQIRMNDLADQILVITNGVLFNEKLSKNLLEAGLGKLYIKISVNGFSSADYHEITGSNIDFNSFFRNLMFLYENKGDAQISIKTMTTTLEVTGKTEQEFYDVFGGLCDLISVENTVACNSSINYKGTIDKTIHSQTNDAVPLSQTEICSAPFMRLAIYNNGDVKICGLYASENEELTDNFLNTPVTAIWTGKKRQDLLIKLLHKQFNGIAIYCRDCDKRSSMTLKQDWLDPYAEEILKRIYKSNSINKCSKEIS